MKNIKNTYEKPYYIKAILECTYGICKLARKTFDNSSTKIKQCNDPG